MITEKYRIDGMHCAACSASVERVTRKLPGVVSSGVNLATATMTIYYDENEVGPEIIAERVSRAGFTATLMTGEKDETADIFRTQGEEQKRLKRRFFTALGFALPLFYLAMGPMLHFPLPAALDRAVYPLRCGLLQLFLTVPVLICGRFFYTGGLKALFKGNPNMDSLVAVGTGSAFLYSLYILIRTALGSVAEGTFYFESSAMVVTLVMLGKTLEGRSKGRTSEAIRKLMALAPDTCFLLKNGEPVEVPAETVSAGQLLLIRAGERIPLDGTVVEGRSGVNEAMLTGESLPVEKFPGSELIAGSVNGNGILTMEVTRTGNDTTLAKLIRLVEDAQAGKAPIARLADKVAGIFVPVVMTIAVLAALAWAVFGHKELSFVLNIFVSVMVIACPCALGLATPTAIMVGTGVGAGHGILFKSGEALEQMSRMDTVVLDKTGTLTEGKPEVRSVRTRPGWNEKSLLLLAASVEQASEHPLGEAVCARAMELNLPLIAVSGTEIDAGRGIRAVFSGSPVTIGNRRMMEEAGCTDEVFLGEGEALACEGETPLYILKDGKPCGILGVADKVKASSAEAVKALRKSGLSVYMITGDHAFPARKTAVLTGIPAENVMAEVLPGEKSAQIARLRKEGRRVLMVGDGINDAPALAEADLGAAIGSGSDIAIESADIVLTRSELPDVCRGIALSRRTMRIIRQNLFWAFFYNCLGIPIACGVLYLFGGPLLSPMIGGLCMSLSSVTVVSNALRLRKVKLQ